MTKIYTPWTNIPQDAEKAKYYERLQDIPRPLLLKRKVGYYDDEEEETRAKMHKMSIDKQSNELE